MAENVRYIDLIAGMGINPFMFLWCVLVAFGGFDLGFFPGLFGWFGGVLLGFVGFCCCLLALLWLFVFCCVVLGLFVFKR